MKKKVTENQCYEDYWRLTLEYSDFCGEQFNVVLAIIVNFIDNHVDMNIGITSSQYKILQQKIEEIYPKVDSASTRKSINQFFKLGFINNRGCGYHHLTKDFLKETKIDRKKLLYSKIMYDNAAFNRSCTNVSSVNQIKFLVKTLESCGTIQKDDLLAIMYTDFVQLNKEYLTRNELKVKMAELILDNANDRKYNQKNFLYNLCTNLTGVYTCDDAVSLDKHIMDIKEKSKVRDPYLQRLFKLELIDECKELYKISAGKCVMEHLAYPVLIASHIKPYIKCNDVEQFDKNNGLLLSRNMDLLFDGGYITFDNNGNVITSSKLDSDVAVYVKKFKLDNIIYNKERQNYMQYHRDNVFMN